MLLRILFFLAFIGLIDWYSFQAVKTLFPNQIWIKAGFWVFSIVIYLFTIYVFMTFDRGNVGLNFGRLISLLVLSILPKLIILALLFGEDIFRFLTGIFQSLSGTREGTF